MNKTVSSYYKEFLDAVKGYQVGYRIAIEELGKCDKETQDLLHQLEFGSYDARKSTATKLANVRKRRRYYKDTITVLEPMMTFLETQNGKAMQNQMREVLGKTRKTENNMECRRYYPRILKDLEFIKNENRFDK